ncbi:hypothetical protein CYQ88_10560, partial [Hydrogenovibrio sp. SC-1]|uniref:hypothetical protein n=1 Tax=Hydrogenovibrio sp. SC-1 TaxID=2065820 RepID=UPI000CB8AD74
MKSIKLAGVLGILLLLSACFSQTEYERLKISSTTWIGYVPLFYAKEKGWLEAYNIKLTHVVSLAENMYLYEAGSADAYVGTQYEYQMLVNKIPQLKPILFFDRSNGGDMILANRSIDAIKQTQQIEAYLELDSINNFLLQDFIEKHQITAQINYNNRDQAEISVLNAKDHDAATIIVTYDPYQYQLQSNGFKEIASTASIDDLVVIDALFTTQATLERHQEQFKVLRKMVDDAMLALKKDPKAFYETVKLNLRDVRYSDFLQSLTKID